MDRTRVVLAAAALVAAACGIGRRSPAADDEPTVGELAQRRVVVARRAYEGAERLILAPPSAGGPISRSTDVERIVDWSRRLMKAELDLCERRDARIAVVAAHVKRLEKWSGLLRELLQGESSGLTPADADLVEYRLLEARTALLRERRAAK